MDPTSKLSVVVNTISSSVRSLLSSFGLFNMNRGGPINRLPNEMMQIILAKLEVNGDVRELIRLRLVSTRWRALVEDYCGRKKSLIVIVQHGKAKRYFASIKYIFFGFAKGKDFSSLFLSTQVSSHCLKSVQNLFANIELLSIRINDGYRVPDFVTYINSLNSLKQLDFEGPFVPALLNLSSTLSKLVHFSFSPHSYLEEDEFFQLFSQLGPNCARVQYFGFYICQCDIFSLPWVTNLTHLQLLIDGEVAAQFVHLLSTHVTSLKVLDLSFGFLNRLVLTPTVLQDLGKLTHLVELSLEHIKMHFSELEPAATQHQLTSLASVLICKLSVLLHGNRPISAHQFTRVMSVIWPNLTDLVLTVYGKPLVDSQFEHEIEQQHLKRMPNLRKHMFIVL